MQLIGKGGILPIKPPAPYILDFLWSFISSIDLLPTMKIGNFKETFVKQKEALESIG